MSDVLDDEEDVLNDEEEENAQNCEVEISKGTKEDFISMIDETSTSMGWIRKFRDYDCYEKMVGEDFQIHHHVAKTKRNNYVGSCICVEGKNYAFVSVYYVCQDYRRRGIGKRLLESTFTDELKKKNIGVYTTQPILPLYKTILTFNKTTEWRIQRVTLKNLDISKITDETKGLTIKSVRDVPFEDLVEYDKKVWKHGRDDFLKQWVYNRFDCVSKVALEGTKVVGFGSGRLVSIETYPVLAPVYCNSEKIFFAFLKEILSCFPEEMEEKKQISLWTPSINTTKIETVTANICDFEKGEEYVAQFTRDIPDVDIGLVYGISETMMFI